MGNVNKINAIKTSIWGRKLVLCKNESAGTFVMIHANFYL